MKNKKLEKHNFVAYKQNQFRRKKLLNSFIYRFEFYFVTSSLFLRTKLFHPIYQSLTILTNRILSPFVYGPSSIKERRN